MKSSSTFSTCSGTSAFQVVSIATRTMQELVTQANGDLRTKTSLLEALLSLRRRSALRGIRGRPSSAGAYRTAMKKEYLAAWRVADQRDRQEKAGNTPFLQEPNVKNGCGGLRDYQNLIWVGRVKRGLSNTQAFVDAQLLTPAERKQLDRAYDFLLRIRTELHYLQKRSGDVLTLRLQGQIADSFGYQHRTILRRMEAFMRDYYERTSFLFNLGNTLCHRLCGSGKTRAKWAFLPFHATRREEIDGFTLENGELENALDRAIPSPTSRQAALRGSFSWPSSTMPNWAPS